MRNQLTYAVSEPAGWATNMRIGVEMFNDFGHLNETDNFDSQSHTFGPVIKLDLAKKYFLQTGYRIGISQAAPDHGFKLFVGRNFSF
jgi:hypothetical protein